MSANSNTVCASRGSADASRSYRPQALLSMGGAALTRQPISNILEGIAADPNDNSRQSDERLWQPESATKPIAR